MERAVFAAGLRTPFGRAFKGAYKDHRPDDLLVELMRGHREKYSQPWSDSFDDVLVGCAYPEGEQGYNVGRMVAVGLGLEVPGATVNRLCASSLEAVAMAAARLQAGWGDSFLVGGIESMSRIPRRGANFSESDLIKQQNPAAYTPNGETAERVARKYPHITRQRQEEFAAESHEAADRAYRDGFYANQIFPYQIDRDEFIRVPVDREKMSSLPPAFDEEGVVTAATSSPLTDGACCGLVVSRAAAERQGIPQGIELVDVQVSHVGPEVMGLGPIPAVQSILERNGIGPGEIDAVEINEAFAIQVLACLEELKLDRERVNLWGGAMAVGHPLGASGLRLLMTLHDRLYSDPGATLGLATLCVGGGQGMAVLARKVGA